MEEMTTCRFQAQIEYDLPSYKELNKTVLRHSGKNTALLLFVMLMLLLFSFVYGVVLQSTSTLCVVLVIYLAFFWGRYLLHAYRSKNGDLVYKRMLSTNNGIPPRNEIIFKEDGIYARNLDNGGITITSYSQLRSICESEHFLILTQEHTLYFAVRKDSVTGGTVEELLDFLFKKGTGIKKKRLRSPLPGKIVWVSLIVFSVLGVLLALWLSPPVQAFLHRQQPINNYMSYQAIAEELEELGITGIDDALIAELEAYDVEYDYVYSYDVGNKALDMLCWAGMGEYNPDTWAWTPSNSGVYWFDMEVMNLSMMYTDFLSGVRALDPQALNFTNIKEDLSWVDIENGTGTQKVSFDWNGTNPPWKQR